MAKDYFQDILPPSDVPANSSSGRVDVPIRVEKTDDSASRGIRSIQAPARSPSRMGVPTPSRPLRAEAQMPEEDDFDAPKRKSGMRSWIIWVVAALAILVLAALLLLSFRSTTVTVVPKIRTITLAESSSFTARPESSPGSLPLTYTVQSFDIEDSEVIAAQGTRHVENKASGSITVFNEFTDTPVKLVKNTRFETPEGIIFRAPVDVMVPGKNGTVAGQVRVTVVADQAGEKYNVGPVSRFTLPGLKSGQMYTKVYAKSTLAMTGGVVGDEPATAPGVLTTAISAVRARLASKAQEAAMAQAATAGQVVFPGLAQITYQSLPNTSEAGSAVRIHEKAHIEMPVFSSDIFASVVAQSTSEDAQPGAVKIIPATDFLARPATTTLVSYGTDSVSFILSGHADIVWNVDVSALAGALAGHEAAAFETIVASFAGVQEAHSRIEPPWKKSFPKNVSDIKITVEAPKRSK